MCITLPLQQIKMQSLGAQRASRPAGLLPHRRRPQPCRQHGSSRVHAFVESEAGQMLQDIIVGGAIFGAVGAALYSGLGKDQVVCDLCQGTGGAKCFACEGSGRMELISKEDLYSQEGKPRDPFGRSRNPRECRVCRGVGMTLCSKCKGSGYVAAN